jgi:DNA-binding LacI/PurR family transcriptional regulator
MSRSTVRQAIKALVDAGALKSIVSAGTFVLAPPPVRRERDLVGIIAADSNFYIYYSELATALSARLREAGFRVDMSIHNDRLETLTEITAGLLRQNAAAVIMATPRTARVEPVIRELRAHGVIVTLITRYLDQLSDIDYVGADNEQIGYAATRHLIELGHTAIVHFAGTISSTSRDRAIGHLRAMQEAALAPQIFIGPDEAFEPDDAIRPYVLAYEPAALWSRVTRREVTAAFCFNDTTASWVQKELRNLNLIVPRDFSLIAVDNMPYASFFDAPLTTFALPGQEIGEQAASLLLRRLNGEAFPAQWVLLPARFIQRLSTTVPPRPPATLAGQPPVRSEPRLSHQ